MVFNSFDFLWFFPLAMMGYFTIPKNLRVYFVLLASYFFYAWWEWSYLGLILGSTCVDYFCAVGITKSKTVSKKRVLLGTSLFVNLGALVLFKYFNFFSSSVGGLGEMLGYSMDVPILDFLLPVGISFYTFQTLSYTIDVYRGETPAEKNYTIFSLYVAYWPQLVAGPIERSNNLIPQLKEKIPFDYERVVIGSRMILWGMFKKIFIADRLAYVVDIYFGDPIAYNGIAMILATVLFAFQIYLDFSAYSEIAIGCAKIMGHDLMENFRRPYLALGFRDFWSRWHISLSTWFRSYLYIPLGGNRKGELKWYRNLAIVFLVSGLWHGANWTFVIWGALHAFYLFLEIFTNKYVIDLKKLNKVVFGLITFMLVCLAWVFFRAESLEQALSVLKSMAHIENSRWEHFNIFPSEINVFEWSIILFSLCTVFLFEYFLEGKKKMISLSLWHPTLRHVSYLIAILLIVLGGYYSGDAQFIYFQF